MSGYPPYSVLMSVYAKDDPAFLDEALGSMVGQTAPFHDMVVVCDGPLTGGLDAVLEGWQRRLGPRLLVRRLPENVGLGRALAAGLPLCSCDVVARMDADDISRPRRCGLLLAAMEARGLDVVGGSIEEFDRVPGDMGIVREPPLGQGDIERFARRRNPFNHMSVMFRRHVVEAVGGYQPLHLLEDYWLWVRVIMGGGRCGNVPEVVVDARVGSGMHSRRRGLAYLRSQVSLFRKMRGGGSLPSPGCVSRYWRGRWRPRSRPRPSGPRTAPPFAGGASADVRRAGAAEARQPGAVGRIPR